MRTPTAEDIRSAEEDRFIESLALAVLDEGLREEGPTYAYTDGGRLWLGVLGLNPEVLVESMENVDTSVMAVAKPKQPVPPDWWEAFFPGTR